MEWTSYNMISVSLGKVCLTGHTFVSRCCLRESTSVDCRLVKRVSCMRSSSLV